MCVMCARVREGGGEDRERGHEAWRKLRPYRVSLVTDVYPSKEKTLTGKPLLASLLATLLYMAPFIVRTQGTATRLLISSFFISLSLSVLAAA